MSLQTNYEAVLLEFKMVYDSKKGMCFFHPGAIAVKRIAGHWPLCPSCCEDLAGQLLEGIIPDPVQAQWEQEREQ